MVGVDPLHFIGGVFTIHRARAIWKSKSLKTGMPGALLEVDIDKICTTPARESDLEVKIVKNWRCRSTFGS